jgi:hypothetical protein
VDDSPGLPDYPPAQDAWRFPPPPVSRRWRWAAITATVVGVVAVPTLLTIAIILGNKGAPGLIDSDKVVDVITRECDQMTSTINGLPIRGTARAQAETIAQQNLAIERMVNDIRALGGAALADDPPAERWLTDWERLVDARERYARGLLAGIQHSLDIPTDEDGHDIYVRMDEVFLGDSGCEVPAALLNPYPEDVSDA